MSNRQSLQRYGFCLTSNKYNNVYIKLRLESTDDDFAYRQYIIQKFYSVDCLKKNGNESMDVTSRHFNVHYQKFNSKILTFMKILHFNVKEDDLECIIGTRSISLEFVALQNLKKLY